MFDFKSVIERRGSGCVKWDGQEFIGGQQTYLPMWIADADFAAPPCVLQALKERIQHPIFGYEKMATNYQELICNWLSKKYNWQVSPSWLVPFPSTMSAMTMAVEVCSEFGEDVIIQPPIYPPFFRLAGNKRQLLQNPLISHKGYYSFDLQQLQSTLTSRSKLLALCHPHNPSGRNWKKQELESLIEICLKHRLTLLVDAIHCDLRFAGEKYLFPAQLSQEIAQQSISIISPNKAFNIAGLSSATAIIPNPQLRERFIAARQRYNLHEPNILSQIAAMSCYERGSTWLQAFLEQLEKNQEYVIKYLTDNIQEIVYSRNEASYLAWFDCRTLGDNQRLKKACYKEQLTLNPGESFGEVYKGFFRLNFACPPTLLEQGLQRLKNACDYLRSKG